MLFSGAAPLAYTISQIGTVVLFSEDFNAGIGTWFTPGADDPRSAWSHVVGATPTGSTGADGGSTPGTRVPDPGRGQAFVEASLAGPDYSIESPEFDASQGLFELRFDGHMRFGSEGGITDGTWQVQAWDGAAWQNVNAAIVGSQQTSGSSLWFSSLAFDVYTSVGLSNADCKFRVLATKGASGNNYDFGLCNAEILGPGFITPTPNPNPGGGGLRAQSLLNGNRTIFVSKTGNNGNDGLSEGQAKLTIQAGLSLADKGDVVLIDDGDYFETLSKSNSGATVSEPLVIAAKNPGQVRVLNLRQDALEGTVTWISRGNGVFGLPNSNERSFLGYEVVSRDFIPGYRANSDITASSIDTSRGSNVQQNSTNKPNYGMSFGSGEVRVRLKNGSDPTGQQIAITDGFDQTLLDLTNCPNTIVDGIIFDGAGDTFAVDMDLGSANCVLTNCKFFTCQFGVRPGNNCLIDNCEYSQIGVTQFRRDMNDEPGNGDGSTAIFRWSKNHYVGDIVGSNEFDALVEGGIIGGAFNSTPAEIVRVTNCWINDAFEGCKLGRSRNAEFDNNRVENIMDDPVETESSGNPPVGPTGECRVHDNRITNCQTGVSMQAPALYNDLFIYRNVIEVTDQAITRMPFIFKTSKTPNNADIQIYHNTFKHISDNGQTTEGFGSHTPFFPFAAGGINGGLRVLLFRNNLIIFEDLDFGSNQPPTSSIANNTIANDDNASWRVNGGQFEGAESNLLIDANFLPAAGSPLANAGGGISGALPDSRPEQTTIGCHEVGAAIDADWPRPSAEFFRDTVPPRWTQPGQ